MPSFQTSLQNVLVENHRRTATDIDMATLALLKAMDHHKAMEFWWNTDTSLFQMTIGQQAYPRTGDIIDVENDAVGQLPSDLYVPRVIQIRVGGHWWDPMQQKDHTWIRSATFDEDTAYGYPKFYSIWGDEFYFYPLPQSAFLARVDFIKKTNMPRWSHSGTAWVFEEYDTISESWVELTDAYENGWLTHAAPLLEAWAKWKMQHSYYRNRELAADCWTEYQIELERLNGERDGFNEGELYQEPSTL